MSAAKRLQQGLLPVVGVAGEHEISTHARCTAFPPDRGGDTRHEVEASVYLTFQCGGAVQVHLHTEMKWQSADGERSSATEDTKFFADFDGLPALAAAFSAAVDRALALNLQGRVDALPDPIEFPQVTPQRVALA